MAERKLWFSITRKDLDLQTFRAGGKGGQHQNKSSTGVRIIHKVSGAVGEARDSRSQKRNRKAALERLVKSAKFKIWLSKQLQDNLQKEKLEKTIDNLLKPTYLKVEVQNSKGEWVEQ